MSLGDTTKLKDALVFVNSPPASEATQINAWPFTIVISAADVGDHYIDLYSQYSRSRPYQDPPYKWGHLLPQWRFTDLLGVQTDRIKTTDTILTDVSGNAIGVTGIAQFYYIDDMPSYDYTSPVIIWATLDVSDRPVSYDVQGTELEGYSNSKIIKGETYYINGQPPTYLDITSNGIMDIHQLKWIRNPFRYTIVAKSDWLKTQCPGASGDITVFDYPQVAATTFAASSEISRDVLYVPTSAENWLPVSAYFVRLESETNFHIGGFQTGSIESSDIASNTQISAEVPIQSWNWYRDTPYVWISNANMRTLNRINLPYSFSGYINPLLPDISIFTYGDYGIAVSSVSGGTYWEEGVLTAAVFGGIYGMAVGGACNTLWAVDPELDQLYHFSMEGVMLTSIDIDPVGCSPQSIVVDSNLDMWVTLWGATSAIKYDSNGNLTNYTAVPPFQILDLFPITGSDPDEIKVRPVQAETDTENNVWVSYEHVLSSMLIKYDSTGTYLLSCSLPLSSQPQGIIVDPQDNSIWVSDTYEILSVPYSWEYPASGGTIQHFTSTGALISSYINIAHPDYLTLDFDYNLWFTFGYSGIGVISGGNVIQYVLTAQNILPYSSEYIALDNSQYGLNDRINGIAVDGRNRVWALNSHENNAYIINPNNINEYEIVSIVPKDGVYVSNNIQGLGDWTGYHWLQKYYYVPAVNGPDEYVISGISEPFNISEFADNYEIRRFNESWDATQQINDYALTDRIYEMVNLFRNYFNSMVGGLEADKESIGRKSYERIANFVQNHSDIDTCEIDQLYSLADELGVPIDDYNIEYPVSLRRLMNIISISHQKLWGTRCRCKKNFKVGEVCTQCGHTHCLNRGINSLTQSTYSVSGDVPIVIKPVFGSEIYSLINDVSLPTSGISLSSTSSISWLDSSNYSDFNFYKYIDVSCDTQVEGVINWDDQYTTISENNSSLSAWYNENELVDIMLNYNLHQGLQFNLE